MTAKLGNEAEEAERVAKQVRELRERYMHI